jgi:RNA polymerase sigma-70 factor (ECF subfamily)
MNDPHEPASAGFQAHPVRGRGDGDADDESLLRQVADHDRGAFDRLYHRYYARIFSYAFRLTRRPDLAEEVVNDVMLAVWTGATRFAHRSRPSTWIFGIAHHQTMRALSRLDPVADGPPPARAEPQDADEPESLFGRRELAMTLGRALTHLSPEHRAVVELTYYHEFSYQEIAEVLACPVNTVKTRMFHARRRLRALLPGMGILGYAG